MALHLSPSAAATGSDPAVFFLEKRLLRWSSEVDLGIDSSFTIALSLTVAMTTLKSDMTSVAVWLLASLDSSSEQGQGKLM